MLPPKSQACRARVRPALTVLVTLAAAAVFVVALKGKSGSFTAALHTAPLGLLGLAAALQLLALLSRTEAWNVSVRAAGATVGRRTLYRASSVGSVASVANGQLSVAARIAVLRRSSPARSPRVPALLGAELPIIATEAILAALTSFTLVGPAGPAVVGAAGLRRDHGRARGGPVRAGRQPASRAVRAAWPCCAASTGARASSASCSSPSSPRSRATT